MPMRELRWEETLTRGPRVCVLYIENYKYESFEKLSTCAKDARAVAKKIRDKLPSHLKDKVAMDEILTGRFILKFRGPPQIVIVYFSGHGFQEAMKDRTH